MIGALADALHRVPMAVGRADGWGGDDTIVTALAVCTFLLAVVFAGRFIPTHSSRVISNWRFYGRRPQPFLLGLSAMSAWMGYWLVMGAATGALLQGPVGVALGLALILSAVLMTAGWWSERHSDWMTHGMLLSGAMWAALGGANLYAGQIVSGGVSLGIAFMAGGSWLAEVTDTATGVAAPGPP
jgi:hypothetical protein